MVMVTGSSELLQLAQGTRCSDSPGVLQNFVINIFLKANHFGFIVVLFEYGVCFYGKYL
jgi:hypothetical protein